MDRFARRTALIATGQTAVKLTQLVLAVVLVRMLTPSQWGETALLLSIYLAATTIGALNLHQGLVFFLPKADRRDQRGLVLANVALLLAVGALIAAALWLLAPTLAAHTPIEAPHVRLLGLAIVFELPAACFAMTCIATDRLGLAASWDLVGTIVVISSTVAGAAVGEGAGGVVTGLVIAGGVRLVGGLVLIAKSLPSGRSVPVSLVRHQLLYSLPLGLTVTVSMLNRLVDKWMIAVFDGEQFGVYAIAAQEIPLLAVLPYAGGTALVVAFVDAFHRNDIATARAHWLHLTMRMSALVVPLGIAVILVAPELMTWIFTDEFAVGVLPFQLFTLITIHRVAEYGVLLRAAGRTKALLGVAGITLGANAVLAGAGAAMGGMLGASIGTVIATGIGWFVVLRCIADSLEVPLRQAFAWRAWMICLGASIVAALTAQWFTDLWATAPGARIAGKLIVFTAVFSATFMWWKSKPASQIPAAVVVPQEPATTRTTLDTAA